MLKSEHISNQDLKELIDGAGESEKSKEIGQHLHECESCRKKLDAMTAQSLIWEKAPVLLRENRLTESGIRPFDSAVRKQKIVDADRTQDFPATPKHDSNPKEPESDSDQPSDSTWQFPIEQMLDPPKHPEMLGRVGTYDIEREIGRGGMGVVLKAHDAELNRPLAIKVLAPHLAANATARKRFAQEAIAAAGVIHPNVVAVHGVSNKGKTPYIVMAYIPGNSLQGRVDEHGPLTEIEIVRICLQISSGLAAAHSQGLVHRDIKPANILVEADVNRVLITDFGLARCENDASLTQTGWLTGTPNYMSPEQTRGERPCQLSDLFSLGSLIYFLATGRLPFRAETAFGVLHRIQNEEPTPVRRVNNQISVTLSDVIAKLLQKDPANRFDSSAELHEFLERYLNYLHQPDISKPPRLISGSTQTRFLSSKTLMASVAVVAFLALGYLVYSGSIPVGWSGEAPERSPSRLSQSGGIGTAAGFGEVEGNSKVQNEKSKDGYWEALKLMDGGNLDQALEKFLLSAEQGDYRSLSNVQIGTILVKQDREDDAVEMFNKADEYRLQGDLDKAIDMFQRSAAFKKMAAPAHYNAGCMFALKGDADEALDSLSLAIEAGYSDAKHMKSDPDLQSLRKKQRFLDLVTRIEIQNDVAAILKRAHGAADSELFEASEKLCRQALELEPSNGDAALNLGYAIHMQGRHEDAFKWFQQAADSKGYAALGNYNLACYYSIKNETEKAIESLSKAVEAGLDGFVERSFLEADSDLESIRSDKRFNSILANFQDSPEFVGRYSRGHGTYHISNGDENEFSMEMYEPSNVDGKWNGTFRNGKLDLQVLRENAKSKWMWGFSTDFAKSEFKPEVTQDSTQFNLEKKYGTLKFAGKFSGENGDGTFKFEGSDTFRKFLADKGIKSASDAVLFRFFFGWKNEAKEIQNLQELQKLGLGEKVLQVMMIDGVEAKLVEGYQDADLSIEDHLQFVIWRVEPELILAYNKAGLDLEEYKRFINNRVSAGLIAEYIEANLNPNEHREFVISRVGPRLLKQYKAAGFELDKNREFISQRVPPSLLKSYQDAGFSFREYGKFIGWRVEPNLLKSYKSLGLDPNEYQLYVQGRVPASLITGYSKAGFEPSKYKHFIQNRVEVDFLKSYQDAGLDLDKHKDFIKRRVDPQEVLRYREGN
ncbi:MAG: protein kinase [Mariniblastus sp.]